MISSCSWISEQGELELELELELAEFLGNR